MSLNWHEHTHAFIMHLRFTESVSFDTGAHGHDAAMLNYEQPGVKVRHQSAVLANQDQRYNSTMQMPTACVHCCVHVSAVCTKQPIWERQARHGQWVRLVTELGQEGGGQTGKAQGSLTHTTSRK